MIDAGKLQITLHYSAEKVQQVVIKSTRPLHTSRLFIGKTPEQTLITLPLLFNVCDIAQAFAAVTALSRALGREANLAITLARQILLHIEIVREHAWWLLIHRDKAKLAPFIPLLNQAKAVLFLQGKAFSLDSELKINLKALTQIIEQLEKTVYELFAGQYSVWLALHNQNDLQDWLQQNNSLPALLLYEILNKHDASLGRTELSLLPLLAEQELQTYLKQQNAEFHYAPSWQGKCYETSCLNRQQHQPLIADLLQQHGNGLLTRVASRLMELASLPKLLRQLLLSLQHSKPEYQIVENNRTGLAQIQTSRGLLIHNVALKNGIITHYQIIAPTEWNFQPNGIAALSLQQLTAPNKTLLHQQATMLINAIDPCVGFELIIEK